jgi:hypothetical protein
MTIFYTIAHREIAALDPHRFLLQVSYGLPWNPGGDHDRRGTLNNP